MRFLWVGACLGVTLLGLAALALAEPRPHLHEFVPNLGVGEEALTTEGGGRLVGLIYDGQLVAPPAVTVPAPRSVPKGPAPVAGQAASSTAFYPDRITEFDGQLSYETVFTPSIAPFKRVSALSRVALATDGRTPVLRAGRLRGGTNPDVGSRGAAGESPWPAGARARDRFFGDVVLDFRRTRLQPLPSVSPESPILSWRSAPAVALTFENDGVGNFFVRLAPNVAGQRVRLSFLTDAPQDYFGAELPSTPSNQLERHIDPMPDRVRTEALTFASELGLHRGTSLQRAIEVLVEHFRSFEESASPPADTGALFLDLARSKLGVCRHRAYAFVITAQALGIPARFVHNEAHAWAEFAYATAPSNSASSAALAWMRVDLGGSPQNLDNGGAPRGPAYVPALADTLPRPPAYEASYAQAQRPGRARTGAAANVGPPSAGAGDRRNGNRGARSPDFFPAGRMLQVELEQSFYSVFRGRVLDLAGRLVGPDGEAGDRLRVEVVLGGTPERLLGVTLSDNRGHFQIRVAIPAETAVGDYQLVVRTPGDERYAPAMAP